jgi:hypothetical protein
MPAVRFFGRTVAKTPSLVASTQVIAEDFTRRGVRCTIELLATGSSDDFADWIIVRIGGEQDAQSTNHMDLFTAAITRRGASFLE